MTDCITPTLVFSKQKSRKVYADFQGGTLTSDENTSQLLFDLFETYLADLILAFAFFTSICFAVLSRQCD
jgi:hypothetical protein